ncbi:MAG: HAMP domain-containing histidine kinase [Oscillospiraceae bacterium]|nr:HAMP domain-containing histidine kinase [Oscillospiraceae bacterium]
MLPWLICGVLAAVVLAQNVKIWMMKKGISEICEQLGERLKGDTNNLLFVSTRDRHVRRLAAELNVQLRLLRGQRRRYLNGDRELKDAVTNISHDLRTPLTAIYGYLQLLEREDLPDNTVRYLGLIRERTEALKLLTEELFRYSVVLAAEEERHFETVSLNGTLEEAIAAFYAALTERGIAPLIEMPDAPVTRRLDRAALSRIFSNILSNALKYSDGDLHITLRETGEILFANTAAYLDPVQVGRLFDRFFSVENGTESTGLGLSIARVLAEQMGGTISAGYDYPMLCVTVHFPPQ